MEFLLLEGWVGVRQVLFLSLVFFLPFFIFDLPVAQYVPVQDLPTQQQLRSNCSSTIPVVVTPPLSLGCNQGGVWLSQSEERGKQTSSLMIDLDAHNRREGELIEDSEKTEDQEM